MTVPKPLWRDITLLTLFGLAIWGYRLGQRSFENIDHTQFPVTAQAMLDSGDWWRLTLGGELYTRKPHLLFWLIGLFSMPFGHVTPLSARIPCALAGLGCGVATYLFGRRLMNPRAGLMSALLLMTAWGFAWNARRVRFDIAVTLAIILALWALWEGWQASRKGQPIWPAFALAGCAMVLGTMFKGPLAILFSLLPFLLFLVLERIAEERTVGLARRTFAGIGLSLLVAGALSAVYVGLYAHAIGIGPILGAVRGEAIGHGLGEWEHAHEPFYYYFERIPGEFAPWFLLIIPTIAWYWRNRHTETASAYRFLVAWALGLFLMLSFAGSKATRYAFPMFPALALMAGGVCDAVVREPAELPRWAAKYTVVVLGAFRWLGVALGLGCIGICLASETARPYFPEALLCGAVLFWLSFGNRPISLGARNSLLRNFVCAVACLLVAHWAYIAVLTARDAEKSPILALYKSYEDAFESDRVVYYRFRNGMLDFYAGKPLRSLDETAALAAFLRGEAGRLALIEETDLDQAPKGVCEVYRVPLEDNKTFGVYSLE